MAALLLALGGTLLLRAYRRSVIEPLRSHHARLLESEAFSRTIPDNAPIGLCLLRRDDGTVLLDNALARRWLGEDHHAGGWHGPGGKACWPLAAPPSATDWPTPRLRTATCW